MQQTACVSKQSGRMFARLVDGAHVVPAPTRPRQDRVPTSTFKKETLVAYEVDESSGELLVNILAVFHAGQDWEPLSASTRASQRRADDASVRGKCVAGGPAATVRGQRPPTRLRGSAAQCRQWPTAAAERAALPLVLLNHCVCAGHP